MHTLSNELLRVSISPKGAELQSVQSLHDQVEHLWQGDPQVWSGRAPILFPIVGALKQGRFEFEGNTYKLPRHGLARTSNFTLIDSTDASAVYQWQSDSRTQESFPWEFVMKVRYSLDDSRIAISYTVENHDNTPMRFTIGSHPAFRLTNSVDQYRIAFSETEILTRYTLTDDGLLNDTGVPYPLENQAIPLTQSIFDNDALVFKDIKSEFISLFNREKELIRIHTNGAPHLGLWAKPDAQFVCIEPWFGYSDDINVSGKWCDKPAMLSLQPGDEFSYQWTIEIASISR